MAIAVVAVDWDGKASDGQVIGRSAVDVARLDGRQRGVNTEVRILECRHSEGLFLVRLGGYVDCRSVTTL
jgi:hypothetical protein